MAAVSPDTNVIHDPRGTLEPPPTAEPIVCLAVVGEQPYAEGVGDDKDPKLSRTDVDLLTKMRAKCDRLAVMLFSGRPLLISELVGEWDALVAAWLPGTEGDGIADVLFGREPFSGTLPYTWPRTQSQLPQTMPGVDPLYPRGHGLSG